jgi:hypothetical protein
VTTLQRLLAWLRSLFAGLGGTGDAASAAPGRVTGRPASPNRASSFHLFWELPPGEYVSVSVDLAVEVPPAVAELYFWALQASFHDGGAEHGGAHLGLQWHPGHPGGTAVNWGGYTAPHRGSTVLAGSESPLPSAPRNPNTRDFPWHPGTSYRLTISPTREKPGWWRGTVTDVAAGETTVVRDLECPGRLLRDVSVWSEVFARCDDPGVTVRWSRLRARTAAGAEVAPTAVRVNYQSHAAGGCANTDTKPAGTGVLQVTATERTTPQGARLALGSG